MFEKLFKSNPSDRIRKADNSTQKLRDKRSKLDPVFDEKKISKINKKIHKNIRLSVRRGPRDEHKNKYM